MPKNNPPKSLNHDNYKIISKKTAHEGFLPVTEFEIQHDLFQGGQTDVINRQCVFRNHTVAVLLYDPKRDEVVLIRQFRIGAIHDKQTPWILEIVAGMQDLGETPENVAIRETEEEANLSIEQLIPVTEAYMTPGGSDEYMRLFCGIVDSSKAGGVHGLDHEQEDISVEVYSREAAMQLLASNEIRSAPAVIGLMWLANHYQTLSNN